MGKKSSIENFLAHLAPTSPNPFLMEIESAEGLYLYSHDGTAYMDLISGIAVSNIGHRHPYVVAAIKNQLDRHLHIMVYGEYIQSPTLQLAKKLTGLLPDPLKSLYLTNSGTEANEGALKLVKRVTGRTELIGFYGSYHGSTHGSLSLSGNENKKYRFRPLLPDVKFLRFNELDDLKEISERTAGVIIEPIQGDAGVRIPEQAYMTALRARCTEVGALLIFDEIQTGFGRTGKLFAMEHFGVVPDVVTMAKAMGGGLPIGGFAANPGHMKLLSVDPMLGHITTFGGNPVCAASSLATLEVLLNENLIETAEAKSQLIEGLIQCAPIREIRRKGLMFAIDLESEDKVNRTVQYCLDRGVICYWFLSCKTSLRIAPPLTISENEIKKACAIIKEAIEQA